MHLDTGRKFDSIADWTAYMEGEDEKLIDARAQAATDMKLIAAGRQIIQEEGEEGPRTR